MDNFLYHFNTRVEQYADDIKDLWEEEEEEEVEDEVKLSFNDQGG
jgi:hypothetical protein